MPTSEYTIEAWIKTSYTSRQQNIVHYTGGTPTLEAPTWGNAVHIKVDANGKFAVNSNALRYYADATSTKSINDGKVHHLVATRTSAGNFTLYIDGAKDGTGTDTYSMASAGLLSIGDDDQLFFPFNGIIDEVAIYPYALSAARVLEHYEVGAGKRVAEDLNNLTTAPVSTAITGLKDGNIKWIKVNHLRKVIAAVVFADSEMPG